MDCSKARPVLHVWQFFVYDDDRIFDSNLNVACKNQTTKNCRYSNEVDQVFSSDFYRKQSDNCSSDEDENSSHTALVEHNTANSSSIVEEFVVLVGWALPQEHNWAVQTGLISLLEMHAAWPHAYMAMKLDMDSSLVYNE